MSLRAMRTGAAATAALATAVLAGELVVIEPVLRLVDASAATGDVERALRLRLAAAALATAIGAVGWALWGGATRRRLERRLAAERIAVVGMIAHDLRAPITGVLLACERHARTGSPEDARRLRETASRECARLAAIADDILELSVGAARAPVGRPEGVGQLLDDVADRVRSASGVPVAVRLDPALVEASVDRRVARAVANAADNAARHAGHRGVDLSARRSDGAIEIVVADDGPGFPARFAVRAFRRGRVAGRAGLGLASAVRAVAAAGGTLRCSTRDGGAVTIRVPDGGV